MRPRLIALLVFLAMSGGVIFAWPVVAAGVPLISFFRSTTQSSMPGTATSSHPIHWDDMSQRMRFSDGTADRYVPACSPSAPGDVCQWSGSGWTNSPVIDSGLGVFNVKSYGATGNGVSDDTVAINAAIAAAPAGGTIYIPDGTFLTTDTATIAHDHVHIVGSGRGGSVIKFNPTAAKSAVKFSAGASELNDVSIDNITFVSTGTNTQTKTAIEVMDASNFSSQHVSVDPQNSSTWTGSGSIGIRIEGRQVSTVAGFTAFCDKPIVISDDPNTTGIVDNDHLHFVDTYVRPTPGNGNAAILIEDGVIVTDLIFDGYQAWIMDKYGLKWVDTTSTTSSSMVRISGRCEQAVDGTGYCIYIDHSNALVYDLAVDGMQFPSTPAVNGIHLAGVSNATIADSNFSVQDATKKHIDIGASVYDLELKNNYVSPTATANFGTMKLSSAAAAQRTSGAAFAPTAHYVDSATADGAQVSSVLAASTNKITNSSTANTNPLTFGTSNTFSGGNCMVDFTNGAANTLKACVDSGGSILSSSGIFDAIAAGSMFLGTNTATTVNIGRAGQAMNINDLLQGGLPAKANNTIASATTIAPTAYVTHITGTTTLQTLTPPTNFAQTNGGGCLVFVFDGIAPWNAIGNIFVAGTPTTAGTVVQFCYDNATAKWYPSRTS